MSRSVRVGWTGRERSDGCGAAVHPEVVVCLGATTGRAVLGRALVADLRTAAAVLGDASGRAGTPR